MRNVAQHIVKLVQNSRWRINRPACSDQWQEMGEPPNRGVTALQQAIFAQQHRWFNWLPVLLAVGIGSYFALPVEPDRLVSVVFAGVAIMAGYFAWRGPQLRPVLLILAVIMVGFCVAKIRTEWVDAPKLLATTGKVELAGLIESIEPARKNRWHLVLRPGKIPALKKEYWPKRIRLSMPGKYIAGLRAGDMILAHASLYPLPGPVSPQGYDFGRKLWFDGIGATGQIWGPVVKIATPGNSNFIAGQVTTIRRFIAERIALALPPETAAIATALIIGERAGIDSQLRNNLQVAGLAHILAISGLHMSLVAGGAFWLLRALFALSPGLALHWPIKKWAAMGAIAVGLFYLLISGAAVSTQRAFIMLAIMMVAIIVERRALSLRNLALAAILILLIRPEEVLSAGFQMSFLAVTGLIAAYEWLHLRRLNHPRSSPWPDALWARVVRFLWLALMSTAISTVVAGLMTAIPAAYHFHRAAIYSLPGNFVALPVLSFIVMPAAALSVLLMPLGLEQWPLVIMGKAIAVIEATAAEIASWPHAGWPVAQLPDISALTLGFAALWLCLWWGRIRLWAAVPAALAVLLANFSQTPDVLIERFGKNVAIRNEAGNLVPVEKRRSQFPVSNWLASDGDAASQALAFARAGWECSENSCRATVKSRKLVYLSDEKNTKPDCEDADIVIASYPLHDQCGLAKIRIDRIDLWREGAVALFISADEVKYSSARKSRGHRPWVVEPIARRKIRTRPKFRPREQES